MKKYLMALDEGTTSCRCIIFDKDSKIIGSAQKEFTQMFPKPGWVEHDASEIWKAQLQVAREALQGSGLKATDIAGIGITNQRETSVIWDRKTGKPVYNAIVWQCRRTAEYCDSLSGSREMIKEKTGLLIDPYFSGTKIRWILDNVPGARERAERGELLFGTVETWLIWNLTGGKVHVSDFSNASRTMLFNINTLEWDEDILKLLDIPPALLPKPVSNSELYGYTEEGIFDVPVPVCGAAGDQQSALFGQTCFEEGEVKNTYGTGCFLLMNTGSRVVNTGGGLLTSVGWNIGGKTEYILEGSVFMGGAIVKWLRDELGLISSSAETEELALKVSDTAGCYVVPAFTGLGAPYWDPYARGMITGLTRGAGKCHIVRAALDSIAYQTEDVLSVMREVSGIGITVMHADGGASMNDYLMQRQADISSIRVTRPVCVETTALGAAFLAGLAAGVYRDIQEIKEKASQERSFLPEITDEERAEAFKGWKKAVRASLGWDGRS